MLKVKFEVPEPYEDRNGNVMYGTQVEDIKNVEFQYTSNEYSAWSGGGKIDPIHHSWFVGLEVFGRRVYTETMFAFLGPQPYSKGCHSINICSPSVIDIAKDEAKQTDVIDLTPKGVRRHMVKLALVCVPS